MADSDYTVRGSSAMTTMALTSGVLTPLQTVVPIYGTKEVEPNSIYVGMAAIIGDEIVRIDAFSTTSITIARGCADTIPVAHDANQPIWFIGMTVGSDSREYVATETVGVKVLPYTPSNVPMAVGNVPPRVLTFNYRFARPYPPGNMKCNGSPWFSRTMSISLDNGGATFTWAHRDRVVQSDQLIDHSMGDIGPEAGTTYTVRVYSSAGVLKRTVTGITGTSWFYAFNLAEEDAPIIPGQPRTGYVTLASVRGGYESLQSYRTDFSVTFADAFFNNVVILLHGDGLDTSTDIIDSSPSQHAVGVIGDAQIRTDIFKTGTSSISLAGATSSDQLLIDNASDFAFDAGEFTIELWVYPLSFTGATYLVSKSGNFNLHLADTTGVAAFTVFDEFGGQSSINGDAGLTIGEWTHLAVSRVGDTTKLFVNGIVQAEQFTAPYTIPDTYSQLSIGTSVTFFGGPDVDNFDGYIDELRITKWVGRYTTDFTPSVRSLASLWSDPDHGAVVLMLHCDDPVGGEGSTNIIDSSDVTKPITVIGSAQLSTFGPPVYGEHSLLLDAGGCITSPSHSDFDLATGDFTVELFYQPSGFPGAGQLHTLFARAISESNYGYWATVSVVGSDTIMSLYSAASGTPLVNATVTGLVFLNLYSHIAFVREGANYRLYIDGVQQATGTGTIVDVAAPLRIGALTDDLQQAASGFIDEFRFTKGICRYKGTQFIPPRLAFPDFS